MYAKEYPTWKPPIPVMHLIALCGRTKHCCVEIGAGYSWRLINLCGLTAHYHMEEDTGLLGCWTHLCGRLTFSCMEVGPCTRHWIQRWKLSPTPLRKAPWLFHHLVVNFHVVLTKLHVVPLHLLQRGITTMNRQCKDRQHFLPKLNVITSHVLHQSSLVPNHRDKVVHRCHQSCSSGFKRCHSLQCLCRG